MYDGNIMDYFPLESARAGQRAVITEIDKVFKAGKKFIILEGPVGCGKSAIGMTFAKAFGDAHMITPRKSLQNQYYDDFAEDIVLMKGRSSYPCTYQNINTSRYSQIIRLIKEGSITAPRTGEDNCSNAPCREDKDLYKRCTEYNGKTGEESHPCPYTAAIKTAQDSPCVIHNLHSFIFQTNFTSRFEKRNILIVDEAHEVEGVIREFISKKMVVEGFTEDDLIPEGSTSMDEWTEFLLTDKCLPTVTELEKLARIKDPYYKNNRDLYIERVTYLKEQFSERFCVRVIPNIRHGKRMSTSFEFIPESLGSSAKQLIFDFGEYVILMSGTIYDKSVFCRNLGINPEEAHFIRIPSTFPIEMRPIYVKPEYQVDTSFAMWNENFDEMIEKISKIMGIFHDAKGLIHAPSYEAAQQMALAIPGNRIILHSSQDLQEKLLQFYESKEPVVFISPVCQQGVDFKDDRARFQIVTRIPYTNTNDAFMNHKVKTDFMWYNYQSLIVFGQQLGRINRSEDDYGATFLLDSRFNKYLIRNSKVIPKWVQRALIWR